MTVPPTVSVIVPTFDRREAVQRAVASVLAQTFRDFELIVVDDGSRDGTQEALAPRAGSIRYVSQPNRGQSAARNAGLERARGQLVAFLDSDDLWLREHLAVIVALLRRHPEAVLASTSPGYRGHGRDPIKRSRSVDPFPAILTRGIAGFVSSTAVRRDELEAVGGFDASLPTCEDADLWLRLSLRGRFALLRRRTAVIGRTCGSVSLRGRRDGTQLAAYMRSLQTVAGQLERAGNERAAPQVRGALAYAEALQLLDRGDDSAVRDKVAFACAALPELSHIFGGCLYLLGLLPSGRDPAVRLGQLRAFASVWPDRNSPTAAALHASAALAALRLGRPRAAACLLAKAPTGQLLRVAARAARHRRSRGSGAGAALPMAR